MSNPTEQKIRLQILHGTNTYWTSGAGSILTLKQGKGFLQGVFIAYGIYYSKKEKVLQKKEKIKEKLELLDLL